VSIARGRRRSRPAARPSPVAARSGRAAASPAQSPPRSPSRRARRIAPARSPARRRSRARRCAKSRRRQRRSRSRASPPTSWSASLRANGAHSATNCGSGTESATHRACDSPPAERALDHPLVWSGARSTPRPVTGRSGHPGTPPPAVVREGVSRSAPPTSPPFRASDVQLELVLADPDVVAGLEAGLGEGGDHADLGEALLEVDKRFLVGRVVAFEEELDAAAADPKGAVVLLLDPVAARAGGPVHAVLGLEVGRGGSRRDRVERLDGR